MSRINCVWFWVQVEQLSFHRIHYPYGNDDRLPLQTLLNRIPQLHKFLYQVRELASHSPVKWKLELGNRKSKSKKANTTKKFEIKNTIEKYNRKMGRQKYNLKKQSKNKTEKIQSKNGTSKIQLKNTIEK